MKKEYVLIASSTGDELIPSKDTVVATSDCREDLEKLKAKRLKERTEWLATHELPYWTMEGVIIASERIEEVPKVKCHQK